MPIALSSCRNTTGHDLDEGSRWSLRILIVDDRRDIGVLMTRFVVQAGHEACLATNGRMAVRLAAELPPQVVFFLNKNPGIDGYETARRLRERHGSQFLIFAVTANPIDIPLASQSGFDGVFAKPFSAMKLNALISQMA
jgi:two-component system OmpR family response regulator